MPAKAKITTEEYERIRAILVRAAAHYGAYSEGMDAAMAMLGASWEDSGGDVIMDTLADAGSTGSAPDTDRLLRELGVEVVPSVRRRPGRPPRYPRETVEEVVRLAGERLSRRKIAARLGCTASFVGNILDGNARSDITGIIRKTTKPVPTLS